MPAPKQVRPPRSLARVPLNLPFPCLGALEMRSPVDWGKAAGVSSEQQLIGGWSIRTTAPLTIHATWGH